MRNSYILKIAKAVSGGAVQQKKGRFRIYTGGPRSGGARQSKLRDTDFMSGRDILMRLGKTTHVGVGGGVRTSFSTV